MSNWTHRFNPSSMTLYVPQAPPERIDLNTSTLPARYLWFRTLPTVPGEDTKYLGPYQGAVCNLVADSDPGNSLHLWVGRKVDNEDTHESAGTSKAPGIHIKGPAPSGTRISVTNGKTFLQVLQDIVSRIPQASESLAGVSHVSIGRVVLSSSEVELSLSSNATQEDSTPAMASRGLSGKTTADSETTRFVVTIGLFPRA